MSPPTRRGEAVRGNRGDGRCQRLQTGHAVLPLCEQHRVAWPEQMEAVALLSAHPKVVAAEPAPRAAGSRPAKQSRAGPGAGCCPHAPRLSSRSQQGLGLSPAKLFAGGSPHGLGGGPVRKAEADEPQGPLHSGSLCRALPARSWLQGSGRPQTTAEAGISRSSLPHRVLVGLKAIPTAAPLAGALFPAIPHRQHTVQCGHQHHGKAPAPQPRHPDPHA